MDVRARTSMWLAGALLCGTLALACGDGGREGSARSPLDDGRAGTAAASGTASASGMAVPGVLSTFVIVVPGASLTAERGGSPGAPDPEAAVGRAAALLAEWLGIPARELSLAGIEAVNWPNSCLGVARPGAVCAQVITPGFRIRFEDVRGGRHTVHTDAQSNAVWAGESTVRGVARTLDAMTRRLTLDSGGGATTLVQLAPGTAWDIEANAALGRAVVVGVDPSPGGAPPLAAWVAPEPQ